MSAQSAIYNPTNTTSAASGDGFSTPRLTTTGRLAISFGTTDKGMMVYDTTLNNLFIWNGSAWESVPASGDAGANGAVQYNDNGVVSGATGFFWDKTNGYVGVNTATPTERITINNSPGPVTGAIRVYANDQSIARIAVQNTNGQAYHLVAGYPGANNQGFAIYDYTNSAMRMYLDTSGNLLVPNGNFVVGTSGKGIDFSVTPDVPGVTSELLNDYEEGTWTGTLTFSTTPQTSANAFTGRYTKVGRVVTIQGNLLIGPGGFVKGPAAGTLTLTGVPFAPLVGFSQYQDFAASLADMSAGSFCFCAIAAGGTAFAFESMGVVGAVVERNFAAITAANFAAVNAGFISLAVNFTYTV